MTGILDRTGQRRHCWSGCAPSPDGRLSHILGAREGGFIVTHQQDQPVPRRGSRRSVVPMSP
jgi:hypothetical protein